MAGIGIIGAGYGAGFLRSAVKWLATPTAATPNKGPLPRAVVPTGRWSERYVRNHMACFARPTNRHIMRCRAKSSAVTRADEKRPKGVVGETSRSPATSSCPSLFAFFPIPPYCFFAVLPAGPLHVISSSTCSAIRRTSLDPPCRTSACRNPCLFLPLASLPNDSLHVSSTSGWSVPPGPARALACT